MNLIETHLLSLLLAFSASVALSWLLVHTQDFHLHLTGDHPESGPQKLHDQSTVRIGGVAVFLGIVVGVIALPLASRKMLLDLQVIGLAVSITPLFVLGLVEDMRKTVSVRLRLLVSFGSAALAWALAGVSVTSLGLPFMDRLLSSIPVVSLVFTLIAVGGLVHATNIVDGLNGLLAGLTLVILGSITMVAMRFGEAGIAILSLIVMAAILGFAILNFPHGKLFCGDAGAYLIGFLVAVLIILLVQHQSAISPWFALAVVIHPVVETLYSAWRRFRLGLKPTHPDARHMHSLWAACLDRHAFQLGKPVRLGSNAGAAWRTVAVAASPSLLAAIWPTQTFILQAICLAYLATFIAIVRRLEPTIDRIGQAFLPNECSGDVPS
jgi:UDP-N-acetylmuramyl pentapeptide phosphotransferase/UDP-N-acetylglucosamine-1-phosphate transferase